jgi:mannan endo-1,4-beta-mannosidase
MQRDFVRVVDGHFERGGAPYAFLGANFWYGMNLGAEGPAGDRPRLLRELDRLKTLGVTNLRVMAATEGLDTEPWRIVPALQPQPGMYREELLLGLDYLLKEMALRDMVAVVCLNNFWPWSGGMAQYLAWSGAGRPIPYPPPAPGGSWGTYQAYTEAFYENPAAVAASHDCIRVLLGRTNRYTGERYVDDPTIMAWQLANEPRCGARTGAMARWVEQTSSLLVSLDPNHLVTIGSEGEPPGAPGLDLIENHRPATIHYATAHAWAQNWGLYDPARPEETYAPALAEVRFYLRRLIEKARILGKPLVIEEFGLARDGGNYDPAAPTTYRDAYYRAVFELVVEAMRAGEPVGGVNFWAWAGEGRPREPGGYWHPGDPFTGDPPHEAQGWYGVYDADATTLAVIAEYAGKIAGGNRSAAGHPIAAAPRRQP